MGRWCVYGPSTSPSVPINRVVHPTPHLLATGDDDGTIKVSGLVLSSFPRPGNAEPRVA
jgi:hypothetical protein